MSGMTSHGETRPAAPVVTVGGVSDVAGLAALRRGAILAGIHAHGAVPALSPLVRR